MLYLVEPAGSTKIGSCHARIQIELLGHKFNNAYVTNLVTQCQLLSSYVNRVDWSWVKLALSAPSQFQQNIAVVEFMAEGICLRARFLVT